MNNKKETAVCLVSPPARANSTHVPSALLYLSAWLDKNSINNEIVDIKTKSQPFIPMGEKVVNRISAEIIDQIRKIKPFFIGLPCYTTEYTIVMALSKMIKEKCNTKIIIGGIHATLRPEDFLFENSPIDFVVIGEGEITLAELINSHLINSSIEDVNGIAFRKDNRVIITPERKRIIDLGILPRPSYEKIDMKYYLKPTRYLLRLLFLSGVHIFTSRGCPNKCTFCANSTRKVTYRPMAQVIEEIKWLMNNYHIDSFYIADDTFCLRKDRIYEFINLLNKLPYKLIWGMQTTVASMDESMIKILKNSGCIQVDLGVESGSQEVLNRMKKDITIDKIKKIFYLNRKYGIRTYATLMFNTPEETEGDIKKTIDLMKIIKATNYGINLTVPYIGTQIYEKYVHPKLSKDEYYIYNYPDLFHSLPDKRFRLAKHSLDLRKLYINTLLRFNLLRTILDITLNKHYWLTILNSKRKKMYIICFVDTLKRQIKVFYRYFISFITA